MKFSLKPYIDDSTALIELADDETERFLAIGLQRTFEVGVFHSDEYTHLSFGLAFISWKTK